MTLETKEELLFTMLFLGFRRFNASFPRLGVKAVLPSPKGGAVVEGMLVEDCSSVVSLSVSVVDFSSFSSTLTPRVFHFKMLFFVLFSLYICGLFFGAKVTSESLTPEVGGRAVVARGFGLPTGGSDG